MSVDLRTKINQFNEGDLITSKVVTNPYKHSFELEDDDELKSSVSKESNNTYISVEKSDIDLIPRDKSCSEKCNRVFTRWVDRMCPPKDIKPIFSYTFLIIAGISAIAGAIFHFRMDRADANAAFYCALASTTLSVFMCCISAPCCIEDHKGIKV